MPFNLPRPFSSSSLPARQVVQAVTIPSAIAPHDARAAITLLRDQIVIQLGDELLDGAALIRTADGKQGTCPVAYLQEVWIWSLNESFPSFPTEIPINRDMLLLPFHWHSKLVFLIELVMYVWTYVPIQYMCQEQKKMC